jgi:hypothetical protein
MADPNQLSRQERRLVDQIHPAKLNAPELYSPGAQGSGCSEWPRIVEVPAALGLPLSPLGAVAVAALAGPFDLGRGPLEAGPDLVGLQLGDRPLLPFGVSQLRCRRRPVTITPSPLAREWPGARPRRARR